MAFFLITLPVLVVFSLIFFFSYKKLKGFQELKEAETRLLRLELELKLEMEEEEEDVQLKEYYNHLLSGLKENFGVDEAGVLVFSGEGLPGAELSMIPSSPVFKPYLDMSGETVKTLRENGGPLRYEVDSSFYIYFHPLIVGKVMAGILFFSFSGKGLQNFFTDDTFGRFTAKQARRLGRYLEQQGLRRRNRGGNSGRSLIDVMKEQKIPDLKDTPIATSIRPLPYISSDLCFFSPSSAGSLYFCLGESAADGEHASEVHVLFRTLWRLKTREADTLDTLAAAINTELCRDTAEAFFSGSFCHYRKEQKTLEILTVGQGEALLFRNRSSKVQEILSEVPPLGTAETISYRPSSLSIFPGDILCLYSDGVVESPGPDGLFGRQRLIELMEENYTQPVNIIKKEILKELKSFKNQGGQADDESLLLVKFK